MGDFYGRGGMGGGYMGGGGGGYMGGGGGGGYDNFGGDRERKGFGKESCIIQVDQSIH